MLLDVRAHMFHEWSYIIALKIRRRRAHEMQFLSSMSEGDTPDTSIDDLWCLYENKDERLQRLEDALERLKPITIDNISASFETKDSSNTPTRLKEMILSQENSAGEWYMNGIEDDFSVLMFELNYEKSVRIKKCPDLFQEYKNNEGSWTTLGFELPPSPQPPPTPVVTPMNSGRSRTHRGGDDDSDESEQGSRKRTRLQL